MTKEINQLTWKTLKPLYYSTDLVKLDSGEEMTFELALRIMAYCSHEAWPDYTVYREDHKNASEFFRKLLPHNLVRNLLKDGLRMEFDNEGLLVMINGECKQDAQMFMALIERGHLELGLPNEVYDNEWLQTDANGVRIDLSLDEWKDKQVAKWRRGDTTEGPCTKKFKK